MADRVHPASASRPRGTGLAWGLNEAVAWGGVVVTLVLSAANAYGGGAAEPGLYGDTGDGLHGLLARLTDSLSYFTIWSNIVVALSLTLLRLRRRGDLLERVLRLDGLMMIVVTAVVYRVVLAPAVDLEGWSYLTDPWLHVVTPALTVVVWLGWGPRGQVTLRLVPAALAVPLVWVGWMLARGAVIGSYPYGFVNVSEHGYAAVFAAIGAVLVVGLVVAVVLWFAEWLALRVLSRR
ncbi:Pr6Pr family membrane protein [Nocardioides acrostichi]|uniref:Pr6Pr family membrane protein n=1 Tax=Nocardioides acrostichi TaxID=2784339 RepID=A0A930V0L3_9ACTN|nr:Pr6Pr family membrane protein [Nocardioides acrostichi]MBF4161044.1 Pr6Pr family membrane protein [Nocardioides acrostichi]